MACKLVMTVDLRMTKKKPGYPHARVDDLDLARSQWVGKCKKNNQRWICSTTERATNIKLASTVGLLVFYVTLTLKTFIWLGHLGFVSWEHRTAPTVPTATRNRARASCIDCGLSPPQTMPPFIVSVKSEISNLPNAWTWAYACAG